jgi:lipopolysaccharide biosynthesis regulator YciM
VVFERSSEHAGDKQPKSSTASKTGAATASAGSYANTGVHIGDVHLRTGVPVRTRYREQVQRIAPPRLVGRDAELTELAAFCTDPATAGSYAWWRASKWAGKSALMSWFVLHPPPGVRVVSFFITSRFAGQSDRLAFCDNVLEQLATILGEPLPALLTDSTRDAHLLGLLRQAAHACSDRDEQFVLVVDGMDEDRGVTSGPDAHSIAALLPVEPPAGMRIIVAGRPNPPVPSDVPAHHPLCDPGIVRALAASEAARVAQTDMERELIRLVDGTQVEQDLLGLLTAAIGGLSATDLANLIELPPWRVDQHLRTVTGRTFDQRVSSWRPNSGPDLFILGHEELQASAEQMIGSARLAAYRQRLHTWADRYRELGWPADTPEYLLRGYYRMLTAIGDLPRMVACATDPTRHDRMLDLSGGDADALHEITTAQDQIVELDDPDLVAMARLAIHRDRLTTRNTNIPTQLPALWATLGHPNRAETLARSITNPGRQVQALASLVTALVTAGELDRARRLVTDAETLARSITDPDQQSRVLDSLVEALVTAGELDRARRLVTDAETLARSITDPDQQREVLDSLMTVLVTAGELDRAEILVRSITNPDQQRGALASLVMALATAGELDRAWRLATDAETLGRSIINPFQQSWVLASLVEALVTAGELDRARRLATDAETLARSITDLDRQSWVLDSLVTVLVMAGELDRAETLARSITDPDEQSWVLASLVTALVTAGELDQVRRLATDAETLARSITDPDRQSWVLALLVTALVTAGELDQVRRLATDAETLARSITDPDQQVQVLDTLVTVLVTAGELDRAETLVRSITNPDQQREVLASLATALVTAGELDRARTLTPSINDPDQQSRVLDSLMTALATAGELDQVRRLATDAETLARSITNPYRQGEALASLVGALITTGELDQARRLATYTETLARSITDPDRQSWALASLVTVLVTAGELDRAETVARSITDPDQQREVLASLMTVLVTAGELDRAETLARSIIDPDQQREVLTSLVTALGRAGELDRAETLARSIIDTYQQSEVLTSLAMVTELLGPARRLIARSFWLGHWATPLDAVAQAQPTALASIADEITAQLTTPLAAPLDMHWRGAKAARRPK